MADTVFRMQLAGIELCVMVQLGLVPVQELASMIDHEICLPAISDSVSDITWKAVGRFLASSERPS